MSTQSTPARIFIDTNRTIAEISPLLFGGFAEHMGRCIYEGIYDPGSPQSDERGFRRDVLAALKELNYRIMRYPGGNFVSGYDWRDGVGPRSARPRRRELAWQSIESNQFGTNEFMQWCHELGTLPMLAVNLGTGSIEEAANLVEYCNAPVGTQYADLRAAHGFREPHGVEYWCLGNEVDGPWQIGHLEAVDYARKAREAAKVMRWHDPSLKLALCGSSNTMMPTYPEWDRITLEYCWELVDYHAMHYYAENRANDTASFLASTAHFENHVDTLAAVLRYVKAKQRSKHDVFLSWDEWNISYKATDLQGTWQEAPHIAEEIYNLEDALVVAQWLNVFLRKCDVLKMACIAQIVNILGPLLTTRTGLLKQTIFYPLALFSRLASGAALDLHVQSPHYNTAKYGDMPLLDVSATLNAETREGAVFMVNRSQHETIETELIWQDGAPDTINALHQLTGNDPKAANTWQQPYNLVPQQLSSVPVVDKRVTLRLPPLSFTVATLKMTD
jgi:alpha-L-arabinofuranosidase